MRSIFAVLLILVMTAVTGMAQTKGRFYGAVGVGTGAAGDNIGVAAGVQGSLVFPKTIVSLRVVGCTEVKIWGHLQTSGDIALLGGIRSRKEYQEGSIEAGVGLVSQRVKSYVMSTDPYFTGYYSVLKKQTTAGLALQAKGYIRGVGLMLYGNINDVRSFVGGLLIFRFGRWW